MLTQLSIRDFTIVDRVDLDLAAGLTALTGETGAGKSIVVDALSLALGGRANPEFVRPGQKHAEIVAVFDLSAAQHVASRLAELELDTEEGECIVRRTIPSSGRSRAFINGTPVPVQTLRKVLRGLVDVHGQHAHQALLRRETQRRLLDALGGHADAVATLEACYHKHRSLSTERAALLGDAVDRESRVPYLRFQLEELDTLDLRPDALGALGAEQRRLAHAEEILTSCERVRGQLAGDDDADAVSLVRSCIGQLQRVSELDPALGAVVALLEEVSIQLSEVAGSLRSYAEGLDIEPGRLREVDDSLQRIHDTARKHRCEPALLAERRDEIATELERLEALEERLLAIETSRNLALEEYLSAARALRARREATAPEIARSVTALMRELGMPGGELSIRLTPIEPVPSAALSGADVVIHAHGLDEVEFLVRTNPGHEPAALSRIASGGELSRASLAIHVLGATQAGAGTLVFDEVDVGIGGGVAEQVGRRLREVAANRQVLCVTHLPQVAAQANAHLCVQKRATGASTSTELVDIAGEERVQEIARMLGGLEITRQTLAHAREMLGDRVK